METITVFRELFGEMDRKVKGQLAAQEALPGILSQEERQLFRHDQAVRLRNLKARMLEEVEQVEHMESAAHCGSSEGQIIVGSAVLLGSSLITLVSGDKHPFSIGSKVAKSVLDRRIPFDRVLIGVGRGGIPDDVKVIPLSRLARDSNRTEGDIKTGIQNQGFTLLNPQTFVGIISNLEGKVLEGSVCLPVPMAQTVFRIVPYSAQRRWCQSKVGSTLDVSKKAAMIHVASGQRSFSTQEESEGGPIFAAK